MTSYPAAAFNILFVTLIAMVIFFKRVKRMKIYKFNFAVLLVIGVTWYFISGVSREPVEELAINSAIGFDFEENMEGIKIRTVTVNRYIILENSVDSMTLSAKGNTIMEARKIDREKQTRGS